MSILKSRRNSRFDFRCNCDAHELNRTILGSPRDIQVNVGQLLSCLCNRSNVDSFIVTVDNVSSQQMHEIRHSLRGEGISIFLE